jgi:uncharacterized protein YndB with AHSA1/START domain
MSKSTFVYVTYIRTTQQRLWSALTEDSEFMKQYWFGVHCKSEWKKGSTWQMVAPGGKILDDGEIVESDPPRKLVIRWQHQNRPELKEEGPSVCTIELEPFDQVIKLSITHTIERDRSKLIEAVSGGWPKIMANLKTLLETGTLLIDDPYPSSK